MKIRPAGDIAVLGLAVLLVAQLFLLSSRRSATDQAPLPSPSFVGLGDTLATGWLESAEGAGIALGYGTHEPTVLLVFHSECGHCRTVAPQWADWLLSPPHGARVMAVSEEEHRTATEYAEAARWNVEVRRLSSVASPYSPLAMRTPWLFLLDDQGIVTFHGHGDQLEALDRALSQLLGESDLQAGNAP